MGRCIPPPTVAGGPRPATVQARRDEIPPPPTRFGPPPAAVQAKAIPTAGRVAVPPPPTRFGPPPAAVQAEAIPTAGRVAVPPPPTRFGPPPVAVQAKAIPIAGRVAIPPPPPRFGPPPRRPGTAETIQRHIYFDQISGNFARNSARPGTHLSVPTLTNIISDLITNGARNQAELDFQNAVTQVSTLNNLGYAWKTADAGKWADLTKNYTILKSEGLAVCHKVPYFSFENMLLACIHDLSASKQPSVKNKDFCTYLDNTLGDHSEWNKLQKAYFKFAKTGVLSDANDVEYYARKICDQFDGSSDNLYIGYKVTNSSISNNIDLHWQSLGPDTQLATASPRGITWRDATNTAEISIFGGVKTKSIVATDSNGGKWVMYSGVYGSKKDGGGWVEYS